MGTRVVPRASFYTGRMLFQFAAAVRKEQFPLVAKQGHANGTGRSEDKLLVLRHHREAINHHHCCFCQAVYLSP